MMNKIKNFIVVASLLICGQQSVYGQSKLDSICFSVDVPENVSFQYPVSGARLFKASGL